MYHLVLPLPQLLQVPSALDTQLLLVLAHQLQSLVVLLHQHLRLLLPMLRYLFESLYLAFIAAIKLGAAAGQSRLLQSAPQNPVFSGQLVYLLVQLGERLLGKSLDVHGSGVLRC